MTISIEINGRTETVDINNPTDISVPLQFNGPQPNAYGVEKAVSTPCEAGDLIGDTRQGGSCNFERYTFIPHCNGTHTECVGHITAERISVNDCLKDVFIPALLISVAPKSASETDEHYPLELAASDPMITGRSIQDAEARALARAELMPVNREIGFALIIRTLPNDNSKLTREYIDSIPSFLSTEAMNYIISLGVNHLLVDIPSIDRLYDEGKLLNHRAFWGIEPGSFETNSATRINNTVTELIYVPNEVEDGEYLLNLQIAPFASDAAPSRPVLFKLQKTS